MCSAGLDTSAYVLHVTDLKPCNNEARGWGINIKLHCTNRSGSIDISN